MLNEERQIKRQKYTKVFFAFFSLLLIVFTTLTWVYWDYNY